ncbi:MAG: hypothetical protein U5O39_00070 [Gammaproteobacteria bacterium]|nr:hypothetical protein [Gammaproteobacteria bacterium]
MTRWNQRELFTFVIVVLLFLPMFAAASAQAVTLGQLNVKGGTVPVWASIC